MFRMRLLISCVVCLTAVQMPTRAEAQSKQEKAAEAYTRASAALTSGDLDTAVNEAVMATTLDPRAMFFYLTARAYFRKGDLTKAALYAQKAPGADGPQDLAAIGEKQRFEDELQVAADGLMAEVHSTCPPNVDSERVSALGALSSVIGGQLAEGVKQWSTCFMVRLPEMPLPLKLVQDAKEVPLMGESTFVVLPGKVLVSSSSHPAFEMDVAGQPGSTVELRPRTEDWMGAAVTVKGLPPEAVVLLDGEKAVLRDGVLDVSPIAEHTIRVEAPGRDAFDSDSFVLPFGGRENVEVRSRVEGSWVPWGLIGAGILLAGTGTYFMYDSTTAEGGFSDGLDTDHRGYVMNRGREDAMAKQDDANTSWATGLAGAGLGMSLVAGGVVWMLMEDTDPPEWRNVK